MFVVCIKSSDKKIINVRNLLIMSGRPEPTVKCNCQKKQVRCYYYYLF